jgi:hypothetical protein
MSPNKMALTAAAGLFLFVFQLPAQTDNPATAQTAVLPPTYLENFELQTNTILVRGFSLAGSVVLGNDTLIVHADEVNDITHSQKAYGIVMNLRLSTSDGESHLEWVVDYDELDSLINALDYMSKVTWGVTQLNGFEATYKTKSGFRLIAHSDHKDQTVATSIQSCDSPRIPASSDQLVQIRSLISQAKATLDALK